MTEMSYPEISFIRSNIPKISQLSDGIIAMEASGIYTNYGPINQKFETRLVEQMFGGVGRCVTVCNATIGLMMALKYATRHTDPARARYVIMPSFTFAAAAHAVLWAGFTPLFCDIDPLDWMASHQSEDDLLRKYDGQVAAVFPYATFGNAIDIAHYTELEKTTGVPVVIDAAASLGAHDAQGRGFGSGSPHAIVCSLHATKTMGIGEGGFIYANNPDMIEALRAMGNFGFGQIRHATMPGLNSKLPEIGALLALSGLDHLDGVIRKKVQIEQLYYELLHGLEFQHQRGTRTSYQFLPVRLPAHLVPHRGAILERMKNRRIGTSTYFSPHLHEQSYFSIHSQAGDLGATRALSASIVSLPLWHEMTPEMVQYVCREFLDACAAYDM
ncbi:DegT/DnrJ/EryC1/StrS family aminotransferase [Komagataeibacter rhaeticus]|nr:DegT/DnrJ/EryC1/StrS family aminotransferase [Komagataeibacter rhaeticus]WPP21898.1 DegT/DnrJ/EryC1/StrS family aminotransferase [Komagataeibacter rhaeticus]SAY48008.1 dTDP-4-amino-4,6-dideoxy-D-glucose transaminase [Komagataeibacter rhaeticus]